MESVSLRNRHEQVEQILGNTTQDVTYSPNTIQQLQLLYILAAVFWIVLCILLNLMKYANWLIWILLALPLIIFGLNFYAVPYIGPDIEQYMTTGDYLAFGTLIVIVLVYWKAPISENSKTEFLKIIVVAAILMMLGMLDLWVPQQYRSIVRHLHSILDTYALILLSVALYFYYHVHAESSKELV